MSSIRNIGKRLRAARKVSGLVIDEVAGKTGLSRAYISQVETGKASPSLQTIDRLAAALGIQVSSLFTTDDFNAQLTRAGDRLVVQYGAADTAPENRKRVHFLSAPNRELELVILEIPVGVAAGPPNQQGHAGEEAFYVLEGRVKAVIGGHSYIVEEGDSLHWSATIPHRTVNIGDTKAKLVIARTPAGFLDLRFTEHDALGELGE